MSVLTFTDMGHNFPSCHELQSQCHIISKSDIHGYQDQTEQQPTQQPTQQQEAELTINTINQSPNHGCNKNTTLLVVGDDITGDNSKTRVELIVDMLNKLPYDMLCEVLLYVSSNHVNCLMLRLMYSDAYFKTRWTKIHIRVETNWINHIMREDKYYEDGVIVRETLSSTHFSDTIPKEDFVYKYHTDDKGNELLTKTYTYNKSQFKAQKDERGYMVVEKMEGEPHITSISECTFVLIKPQQYYDYKRANSHKHVNDQYSGVIPESLISNYRDLLYHDNNDDEYDDTYDDHNFYDDYDSQEDEDCSGQHDDDDNDDEDSEDNDSYNSEDNNNSIDINDAYITKDCIAFHTTNTHGLDKKAWAKHGKQQLWYPGGRQLKFLGYYNFGHISGSRMYWNPDSSIKYIDPSSFGMTDIDNRECYNPNEEEEEEEDLYDTDYDYSDYKPWKHDPNFWDYTTSFNDDDDNDDDNNINDDDNNNVIDDIEHINVINHDNHQYDDDTLVKVVNVE